MFLLDSDIATLLFHGHPRVATRIASVPPDRPIRLPMATYLELLRGRRDAVFKAANAEELLQAAERYSRTAQFLSGYIVIGIDETVASHFEQLLSNKKLKRSGRGDLLNACIALASNATLVTRNTKDYAAIPNLKLENWADKP